MKIVVIHGPNLNMLGAREKHIYGPITLDQINTQMKETITQAHFEIEFFQSNLEGEIVDRLQECLGDAQGIIINPAAYTHSSIAIRDAITAVGLPTLEVHISNVYAREEFRHCSMISAVCNGTITGCGPIGYHLAMIAMINILKGMKEGKKNEEFHCQK